MSIVKGVDDKDFFDQNPDLKYVSEFATSIRAWGREQASRYCWAVHKLCDPGSELFVLPFEQRQIEIAKNYIGEADFDWEQLQELIERWPGLVMDEFERMYHDQRLLYDMTMSEALGSMSTKDRIAFGKGSTSWFETISKLKAKYVESRSQESIGKGDAVPGLFGKIANTARTVPD